MEDVRTLGTYMSLVIQLVVGEFEFVEADHLPHPGVSRGWRVRMDVNPRRNRGIRVAGDHPFRTVVHVSTSGEISELQS